MKWVKKQQAALNVTVCPPEAWKKNSGSVLERRTLLPKDIFCNDGVSHIAPKSPIADQLG